MDITWVAWLTMAMIAGQFLALGGFLIRVQYIKRAAATKRRRPDRQRAESDQYTKLTAV